MRIFEIISIFSLLVAVAAVLLSPKRKIHGYLLAVFLVAVSIQLLLEGARWQMYLVYAAIVLIPVMIFVTNVIWRGSVGVIIALFAVSSGLLGTFFPVFKFPEPNGEFGVGTVTYQVVDDSRVELFDESAGQRREIILQAWYPAPLDAGQNHAFYMDDTPELPAALAEKFGYPSFVFSHFKYIETNAVAAAAVSNEEEKYPVVIYHFGLFGSRKFNTFQIEQLVSHGYIVVGVDNPGAVAVAEFSGGRKIPSLPLDEMKSLVNQSIEDLPVTPQLNGVEMSDGIIPYFAKDISFAIDSLQQINRDDPLGVLTGAIDVTKVGVFGVSLGGIVVADAAAKDTRIRACMIMESRMTKYVMEHGLKVPTMIMTRDAETMRTEREKSGGWAENEIEQHLRTMTSTFESLSTEGYFVQVPGMFHIDFLDAPLWLPFGKYVGLTGSVNTQEVHTLIYEFTVNFFDKELKDQESDFLNNPARVFPYISYRRNNP